MGTVLAEQPKDIVRSHYNALMGIGSKDLGH